MQSLAFQLPQRFLVFSLVITGVVCGERTRRHVPGSLLDGRDEMLRTRENPRRYTMKLDHIQELVSIPSERFLNGHPLGGVDA